MVKAMLLVTAFFCYMIWTWMTNGIFEGGGLDDGGIKIDVKKSIVLSAIIMFPATSLFVMLFRRTKRHRGHSLQALKGAVTQVNPQWTVQTNEAVPDKDQEAPPPVDEAPKKGLWGKAEGLLLDQITGNDDLIETNPTPRAANPRNAVHSALNLHVYFIAIAWMCLCTYINILFVLTFEDKMAVMWLVANNISTLEELLIRDPITIILLCLLHYLVFVYPKRKQFKSEEQIRREWRWRTADQPTPHAREPQLSSQLVTLSLEGAGGQEVPPMQWNTSEPEAPWTASVTGEMARDFHSAYEMVATGVRTPSRWSRTPSRQNSGTSTPVFVPPQRWQAAVSSAPEPPSIAFPTHLLPSNTPPHLQVTMSPRIVGTDNQVSVEPGRVQSMAFLPEFKPWVPPKGVKRNIYGKPPPPKPPVSDRHTALALRWYAPDPAGHPRPPGLAPGDLQQQHQQQQQQQQQQQRTLYNPIATSGDALAEVSAAFEGGTTLNLPVQTAPVHTAPAPTPPPLNMLEIADLMELHNPLDVSPKLGSGDDGDVLTPPTPRSLC